MGSVMGAELPNPEMKISRGVEAGDWQLGWHGVKGWTYFLQQSPNALGWSYLPWLASGNDGPLGLTVRSSTSAGFFRWRATDRSVADPWTADFDGDGVGNGDELLQGTDPLSAADADTNGLPDDWEQFYFHQIGVDPHATAPGGGMTNLQHFALGSNPNHPPPPPNITAGTATLDQSADTPLYPDDDSQLLLKNGNFSATSLGSDDWDTFSGITGWTALSGTLIELQQIEINTAASAGQYGELDAHWPTENHRGDSDHGIQQTLNLPRGHYLLFFDYRGREHDVDAGSFTVKIKSAGSSSDVLLVTKNAASTTTWKRASVSFEIIGGNPNSTTLPITLLFDSSDARDSYGAYIDNVLLLPVEIAAANDPAKPTEVPLNAANSKQTSQEKPFVWWMNDDDDGTGLGDERTPPTHQDFTNRRIDSSRDLEDFAPLGIYIGGRQDAIAAGTFQIGLKWKNTTGNPSVAIYKAYEQTGSFTYVKQDQNAVADAQRAGEFGQALIDKNNQNVVDSGGFILKPAFWSGFSASNPKKYLLFEGVTEGKGELTLVFYDQTGTQIGEGGSLWVDIKNVKKLYDRARSTPDDLPAPYAQKTFQSPNVGTNRDFSNEAGLSAEAKTALGGAYEKPWWETKECIVFVHGWNMSGSDFVGFAETMFKRLRWQAVTGRFAAFRWDTRRSDSELDTGEYNRSEHRGFIYGAALKDWVTGFAGYTVSAVGHSMGNIVCGEAIRQGMQVKNYLLMEAAIPASCYDWNVATEDRLAQKDNQVPTPDWHIDATKNQLTLGYRGYLENVPGNLVNFHNADDFALQTGVTTLGISTWPRIKANWVENQLGYKPDGNAFLRGWGYDYDPSRLLGQKAKLDTTWGWARYVNDSWEMKAFVARPRTRAVGAQGATGGPIGDTVDLKADYGFTGERSDHSGQYMRRIQQVFDLYTVIRNKTK
jgi:hypothetical protein